MRRSPLPAYWIARSKITDPAKYKQYTDRVPDILKRYGGKVLARGGRFQIMAGPDTFHRFVAVEFPTFDQAVACYQSPEYQDASVFRDQGGVVETVIVEGGEAPQK
jgi:uncharacterized protein (DUF1330 family)